MATTLLTTPDDQYLQLVQSFPLRPIRTRSAHAAAKQMLRGLAGKRTAAARDYKVVLASLVSEFEKSAHLQIDTSKLTAAEVVLHLLVEHGMSVNALSKELDVPQSSLSDMLNGRRDWSKSVIVRLSNRFRLRAEIFLR